MYALKSIQNFTHMIIKYTYNMSVHDQQLDTHTNERDILLVGSANAVL